jgi:hypothetical protein
VKIRTKLIALAAVLTTLAAAGALVDAFTGTGHADDEQLYVAPWGRDSWPGTLQNPFATIARAQRAVRERSARMDGDIVVNLRGAATNSTVRFDSHRQRATAAPAGTRSPTRRTATERRGARCPRSAAVDR